MFHQTGTPQVHTLSVIDTSTNKCNDVRITCGRLTRKVDFGFHRKLVVGSEVR